MKAKYVVVKFVPDAVRFEPINIGVVAESGERVVTKMAEGIDPRVRLADPYADLESLREFLSSFDANEYRGSASGSVTAWLHANGLPNVYFTAASDIESREDRLDEVVTGLHARLVQRSFERPPETVRGIGISAARTALREAFRDAGVLRRVEPRVAVTGISGTKWLIDFRYATAAAVQLIQAATTSVQEEVRRKEHAYEAFTALIDTTKSLPQRQAEISAPPTKGTLAVDAKVEENEVSAQFQNVARAHGLEFVAGQRQFFKLAKALTEVALPRAEDARARSSQQPSLIGDL